MITVESVSVRWLGRLVVAVSLCLCGLFTTGVRGQTVAVADQPASLTTKNSPTPGKKPALPAMGEFRKVSIGLPGDKVKELWGKARVEDKDGFLYELSDSETAQVRLGPDQKVTAIAITFAGGKGAPSLAEIFGEGATPDSSRDGTIYKMVRYPEAGYWVSYYAGSGSNAVTTLTIQKL